MNNTITLNDGIQIPAVGFGTFLIPPDGSTYTAVLEALKAGYRHIDTATAYYNEEEVGKAVRDSGIPREEVFITSKLWVSHFGYEKAKIGIDRSLKKLGMNYMDLYLLHQPYGDVAGAWKALEEAKQAGKIRSIGVSNMTPKIWNAYVPQFSVMPSVNQIECNPYAQQKVIREIMSVSGVKVECWGPLGQGSKELLTNAQITTIGEKYGKNVGQVILRFEVQEGMIVLPKSTNPERIKSNLDIFDFTLTEDEMNIMRSLDTGKTKHDPDAPGVGEYLINNYPIED
ncbi:MAG: aldo/keto reductase [Oscillospiraceae bacterium]|nr:aldo/keto reductase [Oscillospiraceae bacterium]MBR7085011.1 aldo/keto reductase [Oscillospiraceae bacterium]